MFCVVQPFLAQSIVVVFSCFVSVWPIPLRPPYMHFLIDFFGLDSLTQCLRNFLNQRCQILYALCSTYSPVGANCCLTLSHPIFFGNISHIVSLVSLVSRSRSPLGQEIFTRFPFHGLHVLAGWVVLKVSLFGQVVDPNLAKKWYSN